MNDRALALLSDMRADIRSPEVAGAAKEGTLTIFAGRAIELAPLRSIGFLQCD